MHIKSWKKEIFTIPNVLSLIRLALIPVYVIMYLQGHYYISASILAVSCLTDLLDGQIARHFNMISTFGKILDPVADKATQFTLILCLAIQKNLFLLWAMIALFIAKEGYQMIAGSLLLKKGKILTGAIFAGKLSTAVLFVSLVLMIMVPTLSDQVLNIICVIDIAVLTVAFIAYILIYAGKINMIQDLADSP